MKLKGDHYDHWLWPCTKWFQHQIQALWSISLAQAPDLDGLIFGNGQSAYLYGGRKPEQRERKDLLHTHPTPVVQNFSRQPRWVITTCIEASVGPLEITVNALCAQRGRILALCIKAWWALTGFGRRSPCPSDAECKDVNSITQITGICRWLWPAFKELTEARISGIVCRKRAD